MANHIEKILENKVYKRRRLNKKHHNAVLTKIGIFHENKERSVFKSVVKEIHGILNKMGFHDLSYIDSDLSIPKEFNFTSKFESSITTIQYFVGAIANNLGKVIEVDFSKCKAIETAPVFMMQVIRFEINEKVKLRLPEFQKLPTSTSITIIPSKNKNVNRLLYLCGLLSKDDYDDCVKNSNEDNTDPLEPIYRTGYYKGTKAQKHYLENKKGAITSSIVDYLNVCLSKHESSLNKIGQNSLEGILTEVLNNAEDHGAFGNWYVTANFSQEINHSETIEHVVGELNLSILNFGVSIYEGLIENRIINFENFQELLQAKENLEITHLKHGYSEDNLFTLYALQDGASRLKYTDDSRGTGTMKFLNSFLKLGDFEDRTRGFIPKLSIYSGHTLVMCDNTYKPFDNDGVYLLTLNAENSLRFPPDPSNLKELKTRFPGTLLNVNLYLSKAHLDKKVSVL